MIATSFWNSSTEKDNISSLKTLTATISPLYCPVYTFPAAPAPIDILSITNSIYRNS